MNMLYGSPSPWAVMRILWRASPAVSPKHFTAAFQQRFNNRQ